VSAVAEIPVELGRYLDELVDRISTRVEVEAAYVIGSVATGAFEPGRSDVDVVVVTPHPLSTAEKRAVVAEANGLEVPARKLELVVYARGSDRYELNFNRGELVSFDPANDPSFWFVLDRATAEEHAVPLVGPPWGELFDPVPRDEILDAIEAALDWQEEHEPIGRGSVLDALRALRWVETGDWTTKPEAARWLRERVQAAVEEAR
jgi:predicted nucleotidyltransferase